MFNILKFDINKIDVNTVYEIANDLKSVLDDGDTIIALPYGIDILLDVPIEEIISIRNSLNEIIESRS